jgi:putative peptidoglycan lipid II flippase
MRTSRDIVKSTSLLSLITIFSLGFGFFKEIVVANYFGAGKLVDAFLVATIIPLSVPRIITLVISLCFIPAYIEARKRNEGQAQNLLNFTLALMLLFFLISSALFYWQAPGVIARLAPGFEGQILSLSIMLLQIMMPILFFFGLFRLSASLLNAHRSFAAPGLAVLIAPVCVIVAITLFGTGPGVIRWGVGLTIGHGLQAFFLFALILGKGIRPGLRLNLRDPGIRSFLGRALPLMLATGINTLILVIDRAMASRLIPGSISVLSYADKIFQVPLQAFILSIATVMLPYASLQFLKEDKRDFKRTIRLAILMAAFVLLPITAGLIVMARPVVTVLFQRGAFDLQDTLVTSQALVGYASGIFCVAIYYILQRVLIVMRKTPLLVGIAAANIALKFFLNLIFIRILDAPGIAVATTVMYVITSTLMVILVFRFVGAFEIRQMMNSIFKFACAAFIMGFGCLVSLQAFHQLPLGITVGAKILEIVSVTLVGAGIYVFLVWALKIQEARKLYGLLLEFVPFWKKK